MEATLLRYQLLQRKLVLLRSQGVFPHPELLRREEALKLLVDRLPQPQVAEIAMPQVAARAVITAYRLRQRLAGRLRQYSLRQRYRQARASLRPAEGCQSPEAGCRLDVGDSTTNVS